MTPAVTANALMRFARVETSTSARIGYTPEEEAHAARDVLDRIEEWAIHFHFDRLRFRHKRGRSHHRHGRGRSRLSSFFIHGDKGFVKDLRDIKIIVWLPRCHSVDIGAATGLIKCRLYPERFGVYRLR